jgi:thymidylate synthase
LADKQYFKLVNDILTNGVLTKNRTSMDTLSVFGYQMRFDLSEGFPALTSKKLAWKACVGELLWFLEGSDDERRLAEITYGRDRSELVGRNTIWTANADAQGVALGYHNGDDAKHLGPVYGVQWRKWTAPYIDDSTGFHAVTDQISLILDKLRKTPDDRRIILSAWNVGEIDDMALPPCHVMSQYRVIDGRLNCLMYQRSCDVGLGVPFNIASYALLTHILAREVGLEVGDFVHTLGDAHIYVNHIDALQEQLLRKPFPMPKLIVEENFSLDDTLRGKTPLNAVNSFKLDGYRSHDTIKMDMAV